LLVLCLVLTKGAWRQVFERANARKAGLGSKLLVVAATLGTAIILPLSMLTIVNSQASVAPMVVTLGLG
jgi:hypothetical protein